MIDDHDHPEEEVPVPAPPCERCGRPAHFLPGPPGRNHILAPVYLSAAVTLDTTEPGPVTTARLCQSCLDAFTAQNRVRSDPYFGLCECERPASRYVNVNRNHFMLCDDCRTYWCAGSNLFSSWRDETKEEWARNAALLQTYREIK